MAAKETKPIGNVYQKLAIARLRFLQAGTNKSGKNMHLEFRYFELEDIVPTATQIFADLGLIHIVSFEEGMAEMLVLDADDPAEEIVFKLPFREIEPIVSNKGNVVTNSLQALGASVTYLRRYLWMMCLDIVESDSIDGTLKEEKPAQSTEAPAPAPKKKSAPKTKEERKEIKKELTDPDGQADELQIKALRKACADLINLNPDDEKLTGFVKALGEKTEGLTKISKKNAQAVIENIGAMLKNYHQTERKQEGAEK